MSESASTESPSATTLAAEQSAESDQTIAAKHEETVVGQDDQETAATNTVDSGSTDSSSKDEVNASNSEEYKVQVHHDVEEVKERLFAAPDLSAVKGEVSSIWGWVSSASSSLADKAAQAAAQAAEAAPGVSERLEQFSEQAVKSAKEAAEAAERRRQELVTQVNSSGDWASGLVGKSSAGGPALLPWEEPASRQSADAIQERIVELSNDEKTFMIPPPDAVGFKFDHEKNAGLCIAIMKADPQVEEKRFEFVPKKIDESTFWCNYMYRVSLIKEAYQVSHDSNAPGDGGTGAQKKGGLQEQGQPIGNSGSGAAQTGLSESSLGSTKNDQDSPIEDDGIDGWGDSGDIDGSDDGLNLEDAGTDNFDMLDDDELLASSGLDLDLDDDDDDEDDNGLEERIKAELNIS